MPALLRITLLQTNNAVQYLAAVNFQIKTAVYGASITPDVTASPKLAQKDRSSVQMRDPLLLKNVTHTWAGDAGIPRCERASASVIEMPVCLEVRQAAMAE